MQAALLLLEAALGVQWALGPAGTTPGQHQERLPRPLSLWRKLRPEASVQRPPHQTSEGQGPPTPAGPRQPWSHWGWGSWALPTMPPEAAAGVVQKQEWGSRHRHAPGTLGQKRQVTPQNPSRKVCGPAAEGRSCVQCYSQGGSSSRGCDSPPDPCCIQYLLEAL